MLRSRFLNVVFLCASLIVASCNIDDQSAANFGARGFVEFAVSGAGTQWSQRLKDDGPAKYELIRVLLRSANGQKSSTRGLASTEQQEPGKTTSRWNHAQYATLVFECTREMVSSSCGEFTPGSLQLRVSQAGQVSGNLLANAKNVQVQPPSDWKVRVPLVLREALFRKDFAKANFLPVPESTGRFLATIPLDQLVNKRNPTQPVSITITGNNGATSTATGSMQYQGSSANQRFNNGGAGGEGGGCSSREDCCPDGVGNCTKVCTYAGKCRDGECQGDADCPSGHCRLHRCVECEKKEHCGPNQYCHTEGNIHECRDGGCDMYGNDDCGCNEKCNTKTHECEPAECNSLNLDCGDKDCDEGEKCVPGGNCKPEKWCRGNYDCEDKNCCIKGQCTPCGCNDNGDCLFPPDCPKKAGCFCDNGECKEGCAYDSQCDGCTYCDTKSNTCKPIEKAGVKPECPPGCDNADDGTPDDGGGTCWLADGTHGVCCDDGTGIGGVCKPEGCGGKMCPDGKPNCKGECCEEGEICSPGTGCEPKPPECEDKQVQCGQECCDEGQVCNSGKCEEPPPKCEAGQVECNGECCKTGQICEDNVCKLPKCEDGRARCGEECCAEGKECIDGQCESPLCPNGQPPCHGQCCSEGYVCGPTGCIPDLGGPPGDCRDGWFYCPGTGISGPGPKCPSACEHVCLACKLAE